MHHIIKTELRQRIPKGCKSWPWYNEGVRRIRKHNPDHRTYEMCVRFLAGWVGV